MNPNQYKSIKAFSSAVFKDRGSQFLSFAYPVTSITEVKKTLQELKKEHPKACHFCLAYRLDTAGLLFRASDDGEPSGSAGRPILGQIDSAGLTKILIVVVRYFGGTLLGVPGLIHAYKTASQLALENAEIIEKWITTKIKLNCNYQNLSEVLYIIKNNEGQILQQDLQLFCSIIVEIPIVHENAFIEKIKTIIGLEWEYLKEEHN